MVHYGHRKLIEWTTSQIIKITERSSCHINQFPSTTLCYYLKCSTDLPTDISAPSWCVYQNIISHPNDSSSPGQIYTLNTVTYGLLYYIILSYYITSLWSTSPKATGLGVVSSWGVCGTTERFFCVWGNDRTRWRFCHDTFLFYIENSKIGELFSKLLKLTKIARIFDACISLSPLITVPKIIIQQLWKNELA